VDRKVDESVVVYRDIKKTHLLEVLDMINGHKKNYNRIMHMYCVWLNDKNVEDFSFKDGLFVDRFYYYSALHKRACVLGRDIKSIYSNIYDVYSGRDGSKIDKCKKIQDRWVKTAGECEDIISCMMREYKHFNSYFEKHPRDDILEQMFRN
jgi:hypothetical protein